MENRSQLEKAAVVLKNLPSVQSQKVLARLESSDLRTVFQAINELDVTTARPFFDALDELARESQKYVCVTKPDRTVEKPIALNPQQLADAADNQFGFLFARSIGEVAELLADEHPREIAVVLTHLPKESAADLLQQLEPIHRIAVVRRLCDLVEISELEQTTLAIALRLRLNKLDRRNRGDTHCRKKVHGILEQLGSGETRNLAEQTGGSVPLLDEFVAQNSRSFGELRTCCPTRIRQLFGQTDSALWSSALRECDAAVRKHVLKSLTPSDSRLVGRQMIDLTCQVAPPGNIAQQQLANAMAAML